MIYDNFYNTADIEKDWKKLKVPKEFKHADLDKLFTNDISFYLSVRKDSGKTTNALLLGLILHKRYGLTVEYLRNDITQTTVEISGKLLDVIKRFGYIEKLYDGKYNDCHYSQIKKEFTLIYKDEEGKETARESVSWLRIKSNEKWQDYKGYGSGNSWFIIWDEFLDSRQHHSMIVSKLFNNISTIGRDDPRCHVIALSNTVNKYDGIFEDFAISKTIEYMDYGDKCDILTDLGSRYYIEMIALTEQRKSSLSLKNIRFFGINNPKFANFTGVDAWKGFNYPHLLDDPESMIMFSFIKHRDLYVALSLCTMEKDKKPIVFFSKFGKPRGRDLVTYTTTPVFINEKIMQKCPDWLKQALRERRVAYSSNEIGLLVDDFLRESGITPLFK